jgi:hypothetical protein
VSPCLDPRPSLTSFLAEVLTVPKNMKLVALPLFELYDNAVRCVLADV